MIKKDFMRRFEAISRLNRMVATTRAEMVRAEFLTNSLGDTWEKIKGKGVTKRLYISGGESTYKGRTFESVYFSWDKPSEDGYPSAVSFNDCVVYHWSFLAEENYILQTVKVKEILYALDGLTDEILSLKGQNKVRFINHKNKGLK